jgi:hypothetical protein
MSALYGAQILPVMRKYCHLPLSMSPSQRGRGSIDKLRFFPRVSYRSIAVNSD